MNHLLGKLRSGTTAIDIRSAGCILAKIILGMDQLKLIFELIGTPVEKMWDGFNEL